MKQEIAMRVRTKHNPVEVAGIYRMKIVDAGLCHMPKKPYNDPTPVFKVFMEQVDGDFTFVDDHALAGFYKTMAEVELPERLKGKKVSDLKFTADELEHLERRTYSKREFAKITRMDERKAIMYSRPQNPDGESYVVDHKMCRVVNEVNRETSYVAFYTKMATIYGVDVKQCVLDAPIEDDCKVIAKQLIGKEVYILIDQNKNGKWEAKKKVKVEQEA